MHMQVHCCNTRDRLVIKRVAPIYRCRCVALALFCAVSFDSDLQAIAATIRQTRGSVYPGASKPDSKKWWYKMASQSNAIGERGKPKLLGHRRTRPERYCCEKWAFGTKHQRTTQRLRGVGPQCEAKTNTFR